MAAATLSLLCLLVAANVREAGAQPPACRDLASRFSEEPASLDAQALVALTVCIAGELGARVPAGEAQQTSAPVAPGAAEQPAEAPAPEIPASVASPPPNTFPSPAVPSPAVPSPSISSPEEAGQATPPRRSRFFGEWPPPAPWVESWPTPSPWERP